MKRLNGFTVWGIVVSIVVVALLGFATYKIIDGNNKATDFSKYDFNTIIEADEYNGNIGDHVKGSSDAPVLIFEYADFQCPGCASINPRVNKVIEQLDGKLAVVYRSYLLSYHKNGTAAASAAEAAGLQGYWKPYADKLFAEQSEWEYASASERTELFNKYFTEVTEGKGDLDRFNSDISSDAVSKKISFDMGIGKRVDIEGTPAFYIDGQLIRWGEAGSVVVNGETISWDSARSGDDFVKLLKQIVEAKLGESE
ncbi:thioredoxin domain-containing protein [Candidatus Saccharibacteria bacterium]|nr:thioredoxin domain-containing protein [Candidatus Saccharibacteria bacterium]MBR0372626.1 thioredoxin domain-containing protein [Candidatus Saccharibacteria bacterium]